ncbi:hypothetical protein [Vibrio mediterranei]|uniref:Uncharacterized protein n=1 Tax=Vibrio mediterranei TaxID=689 RepID=A0A3G4VCW6_9VIBR|nr:hypothetical protein [Vibrio mediterranei]AYV21011.1 hypothetical protein ECB94_06660 [Vibrio mediterranei]
MSIFKGFTSIAGFDIKKVVGVCLFLLTFISSAASASLEGRKNSFISQCDNNYFDQRKKPATFYVMNPNVATLDGTVCRGTLDAFLSLLKEYPELKILEIYEVDGKQCNESKFQLFNSIYRHKLEIVVVEGGVAVSDGMDIFLAGNTSRLETGSRIGFFSGKPLQDNEISMMKCEHLYRQYYKDLSLDPNFYGFRLRQQPTALWRTESVYFF